MHSWVTGLCWGALHSGTDLHYVLCVNYFLLLLLWKVFIHFSCLLWLHVCCYPPVFVLYLWILGGLAGLCHGVPPPWGPSASVTLPCICHISCQPWGALPQPLGYVSYRGIQMGSTVLELHVLVHVPVVLVHLGYCCSHGVFMSLAGCWLLWCVGAWCLLPKLCSCAWLTFSKSTVVLLS